MSALDTLLADPTITLNVAVEVSAVKRSDGSAVTFKWAFLPIDNDSTIPPYLTGVGPFNLAMQGDALFSGAATQTLGNLTLVDKSYTGQLDTLLDYTFAGLPVVVKLGDASKAYSTYATYRSGLIDGEPSLAGFTASFALQAVLARMLQESLLLGRYHGIPTCCEFLTTTGKATATRVAAYDLSTFMVSFMFRSTAIPSAAFLLCRKTVSGTNSNWSLQLNTTTGTVGAFASSAGASDISITSPTNLCDGNWHRVVFARNAALTAYLMIDGTVIGTQTPAGAADLAVANVLMGSHTGGTQPVDLLDVRIYNRYITSDEAIALTSVVSDGTDLGLVGSWRFDDNAGGTAHDYSATANNAAIAGTINTDYAWTATDLGEAQQAGTPMPMVLGVPFNCQAQLEDQSRDRYRISDVAAVAGIHTFNLRSRGVALTGSGTDYTSRGGGVYSMTIQESEPVTFDVATPDITVDALPDVVSAGLIARTRLTSGSINAGQIAAMDVLCPWIVGYFRNQDGTAADLLQEIAGNAGFHYYEDDNGKLFLDFLLPPVGPGPYGDPCLDFRGGNGNYISTVSTAAANSNSVTMACWFKVNGTDSTVTSASPVYQMLANAGGLQLGLLTNTSAAGALFISYTVGGVTINTNTTPSVYQPGAWYFVASVYDHAAQTFKVYLAPQGGSLVTVLSASGLSGAMTTMGTLLIAKPLTAGGLCGSTQYCHVWKTALSSGTLAGYMTTPPVGNEANLVAYLKLTDGYPATTVLETVGNTSYSITGSPVWCPKLSIDLEDTPSITFTDVKRAAPAWRDLVHYARNWSPQVAADIAGSVTQNNVLDFMRQWKGVLIEDNSIRARYQQARTIPANAAFADVKGGLDTCLTQTQDAQRLARYLMYRCGTDRLMGTVKMPGGSTDQRVRGLCRLGLGLRLSDEVRITSDRDGLSAGRNFRVVNTQPDPIAGANQLALWG